MVNAGALLHGFRVRRSVAVGCLNAHATEATHCRTGARLLHIANRDPETLFAVAFPTPPPDNTGIPHILEHAVLNGSTRFPVKDPFVELLKSSMATFLNAITYTDRTVYPVASNVRKDFFNLVDVYLDAVFHPRIERQAFQQEGWHWDIREASAPDGVSLKLGVNGVVFNEMRGAFADPDAFMEREAAARLFPAGTYGHDAGGEPDAILDLSFAAFRRFYRRYYHPANAYMFAYGQISTAELCAFVDQRLAGLESRSLQPPTYILQPRWSSPREARVKLPPTETSEHPDSSAVTMNWLVGTLDDPVEDLLWHILDWLLLGDDAAPLKQILLEADIGQDLTASGYDSQVRQTTFHVGMKGCAAHPGKRLTALVRQVLAEHAAHGFPKNRCRDALRQAEYMQRDIDSGFPLRLMEDVFNTWPYGLDPLCFLAVDQLLHAVHRRMAADPRLFQRMIRRDLLDNQHCLTIAFEPPDTDRSPRQRRIREKIAAQQDTLDEKRTERLRRQAAQLDRLQNTPNTPEALATLPKLTPADLPQDPTPIPTERRTLTAGVELLRCDLFANGVNHLHVAFDLSDMPPELLPYVPVGASLFSRMGTLRKSYTEVSREIASVTGHLSATIQVAPDLLDPDRARPLFLIQLKALDDTLPEALALVSELLFELNVDDRKRLRNLARQRRVRMLSGATRHGHHYASLHAARTLGSCAALNNLWRGIPQLRLAHHLGHDFDRQAPGLVPLLHRLQNWIKTHTTPAASFTGTDRGYDLARGWLSQWPGHTAPEILSPVPVPVPSPAEPGVDALTCDADVCFCASCLAAPHLSAPHAPMVQLAAQMLSYDYLWEQIRAKGGAYGASCLYDRGAGCLALTSYRDPSPARTLTVFRAFRSTLQNARWDREAVQQAIIACAKEDQIPVRPGMATSVSLMRHLVHIDQAWRREWRDALRRATPEAVKLAMQQVLEENREESPTVVLGNRQALTSMQAETPRPVTIRPLVQ